MKTIVLVVPPMTSAERYSQFRWIMGRGNVRPHLGLMSIGAALKKAGHRVRLVDALALQLNIEQTAKAITDQSPEVVGFTAYSMSVFNAARLARRVKEMNRRILTIIGGPHLTAVPEDTMRRYPSFDVGVIGEGEVSIVELVEAADDTVRRNIKGLIVRNGEELHTNERRPLIADLDCLPLPAWELLTGFPHKYPLKRIRYRHHPVADVCTSRGCPYSCTFCDKAVFGSLFRTFSVQYVVAAIDRLRQLFGVREIMFKDDLIMLRRERMMRLCERLLEKDWGLTWTCMGRADRVDPELLRLMKRAGCWQISYGIESGNQHLLNSVSKSLSLEKVEYALQITKAAGLSPRGFFILGLPFETEQTIRQTIDFAKHSSLEDVNVALLTPFPGTRLYAEARKYGRFDGDWQNMNKLQATFVPFGLNEKTLERSLKRFYREFFVRPSIARKQLGVLLRHLS
jgi:anaerobic magnesium-protoporphyrin IX monomethyl ester cyclase